MREGGVSLVPRGLDRSTEAGPLRVPVEAERQKVEEEAQCTHEVFVGTVGVGDTKEQLVSVRQHAEQKGLQHRQVQVEVGRLTLTSNLLDLGRGSSVEPDVGAVGA